MKVEFKNHIIEVHEEGKAVQTFDTDKIDNNILYSLILRLANADLINFSIDDSVTPFGKKLYELIRREFDKTDTL